MSCGEFTYRSQEISSRWTMVCGEPSGATRLDDARHECCRQHDRLLSTVGGHRVSLMAANRRHEGNRRRSATFMDFKNLERRHKQVPTLRHRRIPAEYEATEPEVAEPEVVTEQEGEDPSQEEDGDEGQHRNK
jgi:hypothetical protein